MKYLLKKLDHLPDRLSSSSTVIKKYISDMEESGDATYLIEIMSELTNLIQHFHISGIMSTTLRMKGHK